MTESKKPRIIITGGCGNLGAKLAHHLSTLNLYEIHIFEQPGYYFPERLPKGTRATVADLTVVGDWTKEFIGASVLVHFAAINPYAGANWTESALSLDMNNNVFIAACQGGVSRVVFASSNHVMGGHKDFTVGGGASLNLIKPDTIPLVGTIVITPEKYGDSTPYAVAKFSGERLAKTLSQFYPHTTFVVLRIGWCQPGANIPSTMSPVGQPGASNVPRGEKGDPQSDIEILTSWFQLMWLSNPDFVELITLASTKPIPSEYKGYILLNAMSNNSGMRWDMELTRKILGFRSTSDSQSKTPEAGNPQGYGLHLLKDIPKSKL